MSTPASTVQTPSSIADRNEELQRIVEVVAEAIAAAAALGHQPQRQPHQRAERRLDRAQEDGGAAEQEERERGHRTWPRRRPLDQALAQPALAAQAPLEPRHPAVVALVIVAEEVQQAVQRQHPQSRSPRLCPARRACRRATPAAITTSPSWPGSSGGKRQHVGGRSLRAESAVERADARVGHDAPPSPSPRARAGATRASQRARARRPDTPRGDDDARPARPAA